MRRYCSDLLWQLHRQDTYKLHDQGSIESSAKTLDKSFASKRSLFIIVCRYIKVDQYIDKACGDGSYVSYDARLTIISPNRTKTIYSYIFICLVCQKWCHKHRRISLNRYTTSFLHCCHVSRYIDTYNEYHNNKYHGWQYNGSELTLYKMETFLRKYDFCELYFDVLK